MFFFLLYILFSMDLADYKGPANQNSYTHQSLTQSLTCLLASNNWENNCMLYNFWGKCQETGTLTREGFLFEQVKNKNL